MWLLATCHYSERDWWPHLAQELLRTAARIRRFLLLQFALVLIASVKVAFVLQYNSQYLHESSRTAT